MQSCGSQKHKHADTGINRSEERPIPPNDSVKHTFQNVRQSQKKQDLLFEIEGNYKLKKDVITDCKISLSLLYKNGILKYNMETNTRKLSGDAEIELNENRDGYYITLKDIKWSEYLGTIDNDGAESENDLPLPEDIQGVLYKDEITIQNSGNSMNYYVKLGECDVKYIHLIK